MLLFSSRTIDYTRIYTIRSITCLGDLDAAHATNCELARKIIKKLLQVDPAERISVAEALEHDYFSTFFDPSSLIPEVTGPFPEAHFESGGTIEDWKSLIWDEIHSFVPED